MVHGRTAKRRRPGRLLAAARGVVSLALLPLLPGCGGSHPAVNGDLPVVDVVQLGYRGHVAAPRPASQTESPGGAKLHRAARDGLPVRALELDLRPSPAGGFAGRVEVFVLDGASSGALWSEPLEGPARCRFPLPEGTTPILLRLRATEGAADYALAPTERAVRPDEPVGCRRAR